MPTTVYQTINIDSRNHIIRNRDSLKTQFDISIFFPRHKVRGQFQEMAIQGGTASIFEAQKQIAIIIADWQKEFDAFKTRKARRQLQQHQEVDTVSSWPSVATPSVQVVSTKSTNPFEALNSLDEDTFVEEVIVVKSKNTYLTGWSKIVAGQVEQTNSTDGMLWSEMEDDVDGN
jgi:hypothetical protein